MDKHTLIVWVPVAVMLVGLLFWYIGTQPRNPPRPILLGDVGRIMFIIGMFYVVGGFARSYLHG